MRLAPLGAVGAAAEAGGIRKIKHVDFDTLNVLGIWSSFTVRVRGD